MKKIITSYNSRRVERIVEINRILQKETMIKKIKDKLIVAKHATDLDTTKLDEYTIPQNKTHIGSYKTKQKDLSKKEDKKNANERIDNGKFQKQLLARTRYLLFKPCNRWSLNQEARAKLLFREYPQIEKAYNLAQKLTYIYEQSINISRE